ncbi:pantothenate kinase [Candidatus Acetothermia bacterium]|nr:MAG: pantothenate kinase [Candidatus Acetothermia bacterium]
MLLVYDIGNTNIVVGLFEGDGLIGYWRFTTGTVRTAAELRLNGRSILDEAGVDGAGIDGVVIASVVPSLNRPLKEGLEPLVDGKIRFLTPSNSPIPLRVDQTESVGPDRIANCIAAHAIYGGPVLVLDFGTAITFDLVDQDGAFLGGAIAPEMHLAAAAMVERAALLHSVELIPPQSVIGKTTADNIRAGVVLGYLHLVEGLISRFKAEVGADLKVVATGGMGALFHREIDAIESYDPFLTLKGLTIAWSRWSG